MDNQDPAHRDHDLTAASYNGLPAGHPGGAPGAGSTPAGGATPETAGVPDGTGRNDTPEPDDIDQPDSPGLMPWLVSNSPFLVVFLALLGYILRTFSAGEMASLAMAIVGLGFVVFIHELGHFLVAKWCDVHIETFSIGFGPAFPGCQVRWGETTYMLAMIPLGGYVKMVGEGEAPGEGEVAENDPRSFKNKSVLQRMAIISAGVIMNVLLGCASLIYVYSLRGDERQPGVVGDLECGYPLWVAGVPSGAVIDQIGDRANPSFNDLKGVVATSAWNSRLDFRYTVPGQPARDIQIEPLKNDSNSQPMIGLRPSQSLLLLTEKERRQRDSVVMQASAAAKAEPPFEFGDRIVGCSDPDAPDKVVPLPVDPRRPQGDQLDAFEFYRRLVLLAGKPMTIQVRRQPAKPGAPPAEVSIRVPAAHHSTYGMRMRMGKVTAIRQGSPAETAGVRIGDIITEVRLVNAAGKELYSRKGDQLDPVRLPHDLEQAATGAAGGKVFLTVLRANPAEHVDKAPAVLELQWDPGWRFDQVMKSNKTAPEPINGLGLAYRIETTITDVAADSPAANAVLVAADGTTSPHPLKPGDVIEEFRCRVAEPKRGAWKWTDWDKVGTDEWARSFAFLDDCSQDSPEAEFKVRRGSATITSPVRVKAVAAADWPRPDRGMLILPEVHYYRASSFVEALSLGVRDTGDMIQRILRSLLSFTTGRISVKSLGGPWTIAKTAYTLADYDFMTFVWFLGLISINLAVINFMPIPVLDGGHMFFLVYELIRGRPAPPQLLGTATYVGLALLLSLMGFVFYVEISRELHWW